ncbi:hypothetical protein BMR1_03g04480 [Babesia microti strain RI]|uniref:Uncharacterized protein n=1 Tax=Babesia microti (strain RI) TaxID=1133968 RepID=A0A0K3ASQ8_BABMR|nr:hypothetical protein BMR1_03g04480 [Babesia microti strain RI]CTQ41495.1 hypothetical protein BMR1_03g04480 [Babesia microti strain RI]|eukprot:XP_012649506.1 hypothetical protein BMR1_03g04480 [Babesia microti strain RI]
MSNDDSAASFDRDGNNSDKDVNITGSGRGLLGYFITKYYKQYPNMTGTDQSDDTKRSTQLNETFYTGRNDGESGYNTPNINNDLVSKLIKENLELRSQFLAKIEEIDAIVNTHRNQYIDDLTNLKSLVHSFISINEKKDYTSEISSLKTEFKRLSSEFDRLVDANRTLNDSLQREINLLSSKNSDNQQKLQKLLNMSLSMSSIQSIGRDSAILDKFEADCEHIRHQITDVIDHKISNLVVEMERNMENTKLEIMDAFQSDLENFIEHKISEISTRMNNIGDDNTNEKSCDGTTAQEIDTNDIDSKIENILNNKFEKIKKSNEEFIKDFELKVEAMKNQIHNDINNTNEDLMAQIDTKFNAQLSDIIGKIEQNALASAANEKLIGDIDASISDKLAIITKQVEDQVKFIHSPQSSPPSSTTDTPCNSSLPDEVERLAHMVNVTTSTTQSLKEIVDDMEVSVYGKIADLKSYIDKRITSANAGEKGQLRAELCSLAESTARSNIDTMVKPIQQDFNNLKKELAEKMSNFTKVLDQKSALMDANQAMIKHIENSIDERLEKLGSPFKSEMIKISNRIGCLEEQVLTFSGDLKKIVEQNSVSSKSIHELERTFDVKLHNLTDQVQKISSSLSNSEQMLLCEVNSSVNERIMAVEASVESQIQLIVAQQNNPESLVERSRYTTNSAPNDEIYGLGALRYQLGMEFDEKVNEIKQDMMGILQEIFDILNKNQGQIVSLNDDLSRLFDDNRVKVLEETVITHGSRLEHAIKTAEILKSRYDGVDAHMEMIEKVFDEKLAALWAGIDKEGIMQRLESVPSLDYLEAKLHNLIKEKIPSLDLEIIQKKLFALENEVIPTFSESINELMDSAINSISNDIINKSVEKIIYEILEKLENRVSSIRGIKNSLKAPTEFSKLTIQEKPLHLAPISGSVKVDPVPNPQSQKGVEPPIKANLLSVIDGSGRTNLTAEDNKMVIGQLSDQFSSEIESINTELIGLRGDFEDFKREINHSMAQIINDIQNNADRIDGKLKDAEESEARARDLFSRIQKNSDLLEVKMKNVNDTLQSGSKTIRKLNSLVKKSKDSAKNFEKLEYERIWTEKLSAERESQYHPDYILTEANNYMNLGIMGSSGRNNIEIDYQNHPYSSNSSSQPQSPIIERYLVPLSETQMIVTRQYVDISELERSPNSKYNSSVLGDDPMSFFQYESGGGPGFDEPELRELSPAHRSGVYQFDDLG